MGRGETTEMLRFYDLQAGVRVCHYLREYDHNVRSRRVSLLLNCHPVVRYLIRYFLFVRYSYVCVQGRTDRAI